MCVLLCKEITVFFLLSATSLSTLKQKLLNPARKWESVERQQHAPAFICKNWLSLGHILMQLKLNEQYFV